MKFLLLLLLTSLIACTVQKGQPTTSDIYLHCSSLAEPLGPYHAIFPEKNGQWELWDDNISLYAASALYKQKPGEVCRLSKGNNL